MKSAERKAAVATYKERKVAGGIFSVRCVATGQRWVGAAPDLGTIWNRLLFTLGQGINTHRSLQTAWNDHGEANFVFEEVERLEDEPVPYLRDRQMKDRLRHWAEELGAETI